MSFSLSAEPLSSESEVQPFLDCFTVVASADPGVMSRVIELFAKRGLVPSLWQSRLTGPNRDELTMDLQIAGLSQPEVHHLAACLRQIPFVASVLSWQAGAVER